MNNSFNTTNAKELSIDELYKITDALIKANNRRAFDVAQKVGGLIARRKGIETTLSNFAYESQYKIEYNDVFEIHVALNAAKETELSRRVFDIFSVK